MATQTLPVDYELVIYTGTTFRREFRWLPDNGNAAVDFTDWSASLLIGPQGSRTAMVDLNTTNGGIALSTTGQIIVTMEPAATRVLKPGVCYYSLDLTDSAGTILRFMRGRINIVADAGRFA